MVIGFAGCGKDDDDNSNSGVGSNIEGTYVGQIKDNAGATMVENASILIEAQDENHVKISMNQVINYLAESFDLNVSCPNTMVTESNGVYTLNGQTNVTLNIAMLGGETELTVVINGTIENNQANLTMVISTVGGLIPLYTVVFVGAK